MRPLRKNLKERLIVISRSYKSLDIDCLILGSDCAQRFEESGGLLIKPREGSIDL